jgi:dual specificity phosphatase 12
MIVYQAFNKHQINIDDTDEEDVLVHFLPAIAFIQAELDNDRGVLVHCQAGMSASCIAIYPVFINSWACLRSKRNNCGRVPHVLPAD